MGEAAPAGIEHARMCCTVNSALGPGVRAFCYRSPAPSSRLLPEGFTRSD